MGRDSNRNHWWLPTCSGCFMVSHENGFDDFLLGQRPGPLFYAGISSFRVVVVMRGRHRRWRSVCIDRRIFWKLVGKEGG